MIELARILKLPEKLINELCMLNTGEMMTLSEKCLEKGFSALSRKNDVERLGVILCCALKAKEQYEKMGISDEIYYHTMSDIKIWCENNKNKGLRNYGWISNHVRCELFRLGRLQFQLYPCRNKTLLYKKLPFAYGENLIYVHIPQGEKLSFDECIKSFRMAEEFFKEYFPHYNYRYYFCESWLLYEGNRDFMKADSNILKFSSMFTHAYSVKIDEQAIERIFGKRRLLKRNYPENTSLQKMLMYGKEASNRKQEIDRQHYTIPNQRPKDKHCGKI